MKSEILTFDKAVANIILIDNIIYVHIFGEYTDFVAESLIKYIDPIINTLTDDPVRIWDASDIPENGFKLTNDFILKISKWSKDIKTRFPNSTAYMVAPTAISFGISRMYQLTSNTDNNGVIIIPSTSDLPNSIKGKIPNKMFNPSEI